jgi:hypothetical protein
MCITFIPPFCFSSDRKWDAQTVRRVFQCWLVTAAGAMGRGSGVRPRVGIRTTRADVTILGEVKALLARRWLPRCLSRPTP